MVASDLQHTGKSVVAAFGRHPVMADWQTAALFPLVIVPLACLPYAS